MGHKSDKKKTGAASTQKSPQRRDKNLSKKKAVKKTGRKTDSRKKIKGKPSQERKISKGKKQAGQGKNIKNSTSAAAYLSGIMDVMESEKPASPALSGHTAIFDLVSDSEEDKKLLYERAKHIARAKSEQADAPMEQFVRFRLGKTEQYGIPFRFADEVVNASEIITVPCLPDFISGIINLRGELITIINLHYFFHVSNTVKDNNSLADADVIIVSASGISVGLLIDEVMGDGSYSTSELNPPLPSSGISNIHYVEGVSPDNTTIINIETLLADPELRIEHR